MINSNYFYLIVVLLVVGTITIRGSFIFYSHKINITPKLKELFTYIPAAIFPAIIMPSSFYHQGEVDWLMNKERFMTLIIAMMLCHFVRNTFAIILFGLALLFMLKSL